MKKAGVYEVVPNPYYGWDVKRRDQSGSIRHFTKEEDAIHFMEELAGEAAGPQKVVLDIAESETAPIRDQEEN